MPKAKKSREKLENEIAELESELNAFDWALEFPKLCDENGEFAGFDVVIGNPPYIKEYENRHAFDGLHELPEYQGKMDLWYLFGSKGLELLKENGYLCYIAPNNWTTNSGASKFRNYIINNSKIIQLIDFGSYFVFDSSGIQTMIMMFQKNTLSDNYTFDYRQIALKKPNFENALQALKNKNSSEINYIFPTIFRENLFNKTLHFTNNEVDALLNKIQNKSNFKFTKKDLANAIIPNPDYINNSIINKIPAEKRKLNHIKIGDGVFVIKKNYFNDLNELEKQFLKPLIEAEDVDRYLFPNEVKQEIIYFTRKNFNGIGCPNLLAHLDKFKEIMLERRETANGSMSYYHLHWARNEAFFKESEKIISIRKCCKPTFAFTEKEAYVTGKFYVIKTKHIDLKYVTGLLNSKLIEFWLRYRGKMQGIHFQIDKEPLLNLPLLNINNKYSEKIIENVNKILELKSVNPKSNTLELEQMIDILIFKLYELNYNEIQIIDNNISFSESEFNSFE